MKRISLSAVGVTLVLGVALAMMPPTVAASTITMFDVPSSPGAITGIAGINSSGVIAGTWEGASGSLGFVRAANGTITTFGVVYVGSTPAPTSVSGINDQGTIVGTWTQCINKSGPCLSKGFSRSATGVITVFNANDTEDSYRFDSINNQGVIVGLSTNPKGMSTPFVIDPAGHVTYFSIPGGWVNSTSPLKINGVGQVVGVYGSDYTLMFMRNADGTVQTISAPCCFVGLDDSGTIVGSDSQFSWERFPDGTIQALTFQQTSYPPYYYYWSQVAAINPTPFRPGFAGRHTYIVGSLFLEFPSLYLLTADGFTFYRGFPANQMTTYTFDPNSDNWTFPVAVNNNGVVAGLAEESDWEGSGYYRGFIKTP